ncbi:MAG: (Fe-S)-binding protein [Desulfovibrionaceae bacterium]
MADIKKLVSMLKELDDQLVTCMKCGMCQAVCPLFLRTGKETDVTRGKLALIDGLASEILKDAEGVNETLNRCLLCGTCQANCPSGVQIVDIFLKARAVMTGYFGLSPAKKLIFRRLLAHPGMFNLMTSLAGKFQGMFTKPADKLLGSSCARFNSPLVGDRHFNTLAEKPLRKSVSSLDEPAGSSGLRVALFPGCVIDKVYPGVGLASIKALRHHGVGIYMPSGQACCGIPVLSSGDRDTFDDLVRQNLAKFRAGKFDYLLTACATCTSTIKELWPSMYTGSEEDRKALREMAAKTMDISQFLVDVIGVDAVASPAKAALVTYHDPCHLKNSLGITAQPRKVLNANPAYKLVEMAEAGVCCGCGGSFNINHYDLSKEIGGRKADNVIASGAEVAATSCPACMLQLTDMLSRKNKGVRVKHVIECYAEMIS